MENSSFSHSSSNAQVDAMASNDSLSVELAPSLEWSPVSQFNTSPDISTLLSTTSQAVVGSVRSSTNSNWLLQNQNQLVLPPPPSPSTSDHQNEIFVGDLSFFCEEKDLYDLFGHFGNVESCRVVRNDARRRSLMFGFVCMSNVAEAMRATSVLHGRSFMGRTMKVELSAKRSSEGQQSRQTPSYLNGFQVHLSFSSSFPHGCSIVKPTEEFLRGVFGRYGNIVDVLVREYSIHNTLSKQEGYGFLTFEEESSAVMAAHECCSIVVDDVLIKCTLSFRNKVTGKKSSSSPSTPSFIGNGAEEPIISRDYLGASSGKNRSASMGGASFADFHAVNATRFPQPDYSLPFAGNGHNMNQESSQQRLNMQFRQPVRSFSSGSNENHSISTQRHDSRLQSYRSHSVGTSSMISSSNRLQNVANSQGDIQQYEFGRYPDHSVQQRHGGGQYAQQSFSPTYQSHDTYRQTFNDNNRQFSPVHPFQSMRPGTHHGLPAMQQRLAHQQHLRNQNRSGMSHFRQTPSTASLDQFKSSQSFPFSDWTHASESDQSRSAMSMSDFSAGLSSHSQSTVNPPLDWSDGHVRDANMSRLDQCTPVRMSSQLDDTAQDFVPLNAFGVTLSGESRLQSFSSSQLSSHQRFSSQHPESKSPSSIFRINGDF